MGEPLTGLLGCWLRVATSAGCRIWPMPDIPTPAVSLNYLLRRGQPLSRECPNSRPVKRPGDGLAPLRVQGLAAGRVHGGLPDAVHRPVGADVIFAGPEADGEAR